MDVRKKGWARVGAVVILTLALIYVVRLTGLMLTARQAAQVESGLAAEVSTLHQEIHALATLSTTAGSPAYVEQWARDNRHLIKPGDHPVEPVAGGSTSGPGAPAGKAPAGEGWWERFTRWLGGG